MATTSSLEVAIEDDFEQEEALLLKRAEDKPTLRIINADQAKPIEEWQRLYPDQALFIEVTKEDFSKIYEGKLIATAGNSIEFLDLRKDFRRRNIVNLTAYGDTVDDGSIPLPPAFWLAGVSVEYFL
ncbi:MAG: hypothetical protein ACRD82_09970 [Blastocatellia bacterium]